MFLEGILLDPEEIVDGIFLGKWGIRTINNESLFFHQRVYIQKQSLLL